MYGSKASLVFLLYTPLGDIEANLVDEALPQVYAGVEAKTRKSSEQRLDLHFVFRKQGNACCLFVPLQMQVF